MEMRFTPILFTLALAAALLPLGGALADMPAPLAWWVFDGDAEVVPDHSGNGNGAGILAAGGVWRVGDPLAGAALWFDGGKPAGDPLAGHGYAESRALAGKLPGPALSVSAWVRPASLPQYAPIITKVTDPDAWDDGFGVYANPAEGGLVAFAGGYLAVSLKAGWPAARPGEWAHVCLALDGAAAKFYVNGRLRSSAAVPAGVPLAVGAPVRVGTLAGHEETWAWHGAVADVRVWDAALSEDDVLAVFAGSPLAGAADSLGRGIPDLWAIFYGLDPLDPALAGQALSGDGLTNLQKYRMGMDPNKAAEPPLAPMLRIHTPLEK